MSSRGVAVVFQTRGQFDFVARIFAQIAPDRFAHNIGISRHNSAKCLHFGATMETSCAVVRERSTMSAMLSSVGDIGHGRHWIARAAGRNSRLRALLLDGKPKPIQ